MSDEYLERIRAAADILELVTEVVSLKHYGRDRYKGCCPFHDEDSPSFTVDNGKYYCFGCGEGGDAIKFVQQTKGLTFNETLNYLGDRYGIQKDGTQRRVIPRPKMRPVQGIKQPIGYVAPQAIPPATYDPIAAALLEDCRTSYCDHFLTAGITPTQFVEELKNDLSDLRRA